MALYSVIMALFLREGGSLFPIKRLYHAEIFTIWIINKMIGYLIWNHYKNWLIFAHIKLLDNNSSYLVFNNLPIGWKENSSFILILPQMDEAIEFYWWNSPKKNINYIESMINCDGKSIPYDEELVEMLNINEEFYE